jgi:hippurate hydrolase
VAGAQIVTALQTVVSRNADPIEPTVVTLGSFRAGTTHNVIPDKAIIQANIRTFTRDTRAMVLRRIEEIVSGIAASMGVSATLTIGGGSPPVVNDSAMTRYARTLALSLYGQEGVEENSAVLSYSDDMSEFLDRRPGSYILIGNGADSVPLHHPKYDFADQAIARGAHFWRHLVVTYLRDHKA